MKRLTVCVAIVVVLTLAAKGWGREWKDTTGKFSVEADFAGMEGDSIVKLEKENGEIVNVPLLRLNTKDRKYVEWMIGIETGETLAREVGKAFRWEGDTTVKAALSQKQAREEFFGRFNGRRITIRFPIANVGESEEGVYSLSLSSPRLPANVEYDHGPQFSVRLAKEDALTIGATSVLVVSGKARLESSYGGRRYVIRFPYRGSGGVKDVVLYLDQLEYSVEIPEAEERVKKVIDTPIGRIEMSQPVGLPQDKEGPADPAMYYTTEKLDDGNILVTIRNTPLGDVRAVSTPLTHDPAAIALHGSYNFKVRGNPYSPWVSIEQSADGIKSVKWDGRSVRQGREKE